MHGWGRPRDRWEGLIVCDGPQQEHHLVGGGTVRRVEAQQAVDHPRQGAGNGATERSQRRTPPPRAPLAGRNAGQALMEGGTQRVGVDAEVVGQSDPLLGRHVGDGAHHRRARLAGGSEPCGAEVENGGLPVVVDVNIGGLEVAVGESDAVDAGDAQGDLCAGMAQALHALGEGVAGLHPGVEGDAAGDVHREPGPPAVDARLVHAHDMGKPQRPELLELQPKLRGVGGRLQRRDLHRPLRTVVGPRQPHLAVAAHPQALVQRVGPEA